MPYRVGAGVDGRQEPCGGDNLKAKVDPLMSMLKT